MKPATRSSALFLALLLVPSLALAAIPSLDQLYAKAGILDSGMLSRTVRGGFQAKYRDVSQASAARSPKLLAELENQMKAEAQVIRLYMACREAVDQDAGKDAACSKEVLAKLERSIDLAKLQDLKRALNPQELPGTSCTEDELFSCVIQCSEQAVCSCCQS